MLLCSLVFCSQWQELCGARSNRAFDPVEVRFACGSMVLFFLFHKNIHNVNVFVKRPRIFCPAEDDIPRQTRNRLIHSSIGRFAGFAHVVLFVVQPPTAYFGLLTGVTRWACKSGICPGQRQNRLRQHGMGSSALPEADRAVHAGEHLA